MFVKIIYRHFVFNQEKYQVCKFRIYRHFVKSVNGSNFPVYMNPGPAKMSQKPEKGDTENVVAVWNVRWLSTASRHWKISEEHQIYLPIWKVSCHRSIISGLLGSFNGIWQGFSMACWEIQLRLVDLFTFPGLNPFETSNWVNLHGAARLRNNFCQEENYITLKNSSCTC